MLKPTRLIYFICLIALAVNARTTFGDSPLAPMEVPDGFGVNIHFIHPRPGEMKMLADSGVRWIRTDFHWEASEKSKGVYDFSVYDSLLKSMDQYHIRVWWVLDYGNKLYDSVSPHTDEDRAAFAAWASAAVKHFAGRGVIWEMWNEPNISFWKPKPNADDYAKLALVTGKAIHDAAPDEIYIGPATSRIDLRFCETCFAAGCLQYWSAVSVHPYRSSSPETVVDEYQKLRDLIGKYASAGKTIPIFSGEWGYSTAWKNCSDARQAQYLSRQLLINQWQQIPISIWYDWHDDGINPTDPEHHFGMVRNKPQPDADSIYNPKPAYNAAKTLTTQLSGFHCAGRLKTEDPNDYILVFRNGDASRLAAWTTSEQAHKLSIAASPGKFDVTSMTGETKSTLEAAGGHLTITVSDEPQYLAPVGANAILNAAVVEHP
jgi:hypothetical protein